ncbi:MAG TPA: hypothetical protein DEB74_18570 [Lachnospiraceae bacterium]|nr:hypothetical protein [Lachnospiraceae bacterium]
MMKRNILIVEDDKTYLKALVEIAKQCDNAGTIFCAETKEEAYTYAVEEQIDLFLIDIILNSGNSQDVSGMVFAENLRQMERYKFVPIIFITALIDEYMHAFHKLHSYGYVEKPFDINKLKELITSALKMPLASDKENLYLYFRQDGVIYSIIIEIIMWIETKDRILIVHTEDEDFEIRYKTCNSIRKELPRRRFLQCSRKAIVNRKYIKSIDRINRYITLKNGTNVEIGSTMRKRFFQELGNNDKFD